MAKFLNYEDRLEIESGLKEHMTFTELGEKLGTHGKSYAPLVRFLSPAGPHNLRTLPYCLLSPPAAEVLLKNRKNISALPAFVSSLSLL